MSSTAPGLTAQTGPTDALFLSDSLHDSAFNATEVQTTTNFVRDFIDLAPVTGDDTVGSGKEVTFDIDKSVHLWGSFNLEFVVSALTSGGAGTTLRFANYLPLLLIESVRVVYGTNELQNISGLALLARYARDKLGSEEQQRVVDQQLLGGMSAVEREARAASPQKVTIPDIPLFFGQDLTNTLFSRTLRDAVRIKIKFRNFSDPSLVQSDYSGAWNFSITGIKLRGTGYNVTEPELRLRMDEISLADGGRFYNVDYPQEESDVVIPAGTDGRHTVSLKNVSGTVKDIHFILRRRADIENDLSALPNPDPLRVEPFAALEIKGSSNMHVIPRITYEELMHVHGPEMYGYASVMPHPAYSHGHAVVERHSMGHMNYGNIQGLKLILEFAQPLAADCVLQVVAFTNNTVQYHRSDLSRLLV